MSEINKTDGICATCGVEKPYADYGCRKDGDMYKQCTQCWRTGSRDFWSTKSFRICKCCSERLSLTQFQRDKHGIPYPFCIPCYEIKVWEQYHKIRENLKKV